ncbi:MAG: hypothetical protein HUU50_11465 [Candidatus Brocadiae bacterium]|nr:hypothetical protein [Candidatus Brocadiia bacterium]
MKIIQKSFFYSFWGLFLLVFILGGCGDSSSSKTEQKEIEIFGSLNSLGSGGGNRVASAGFWLPIYEDIKQLNISDPGVTAIDNNGNILDARLYISSHFYYCNFYLRSDTKYFTYSLFDKANDKFYFNSKTIDVDSLDGLSKIYDDVAVGKFQIDQKIPMNLFLHDSTYGDLTFDDSMAGRSIKCYIHDLEAKETNLGYFSYFIEPVYMVNVLFPYKDRKASAARNKALVTMVMKMHEKYQNGVYLNPKTNQKFQSGDTVELWYQTQNGLMEIVDAFPDDPNKQDAEITEKPDGLYIHFQINQEGNYLCGPVNERACVTFRLLDGKGMPLPYTKVLAKGVNSTFQNQANTDKDGKAKLYVKKATSQEKSTISVLMGNFIAKLAEINNPDYSHENGCMDLGDLALQDFCEIEGYVTDGNGKGVEDYIIKTNAQGEAVTDANGYYKISDHVANKIQILLYNKNQEYQQKKEVEALAGETNKVDFVLSFPAPSVDLVQPEAGQKFLPGQTIDLKAEIPAVRNAIVSVKFYEGDNLIGEVTSSPYNFSWTPGTTGKYLLYAIATDDKNLTGKSNPADVLVNTPPQIAITSPVANTIFLKEGQAVDIAITAQANDAEGNMASISFFNNDNMIGHQKEAKASFTWTNAPVGIHNLKALAKDNLGEAVFSDTVKVVVNGKPGIVFQSPSHNQIFPTPANVNMSVSVQDQERTVVSVTFYANGIPVSTIPSPGPYSYVWTNAPTGKHNLKATVKDDFGSEASTTLDIEVLDDPMVVTPTSSLKSHGLPGGPFNPESQTYTISVLQRSVSWRASKTASWLTISPESGTSNPGQPSQVVVSINASANSLPSGLYKDSINFINLTNGQGNTTRDADLSINYNPSIAITSPQEGSVFLTNSLVAIETSVSDPDRKKRSVQKVDFYANEQKIATVSTSPYSYSWKASDQGQYAVKAIVTDSLGASVTSNTVNIVVNNAPSVVLQSPVDGSLYLSNSDILLRAMAQDSRRRGISKVEFFQNGILIGQGNPAGNGLYEYTWKNASAGTYSIKARATDNYNTSIDSSSVSIEVNNPPVVSITSPANNAVFLANSPISIQANATDARKGKRSIQKVDFYANMIYLGTATTGSNSIYTITWQNPSQGSYALKAKATDDKNFVTESEAVNIKVNAAPGISITSPANGSVFATNRTVNIVTKPVDADRNPLKTVASVEIYANNQKIATLTSEPYSYAWIPDTPDSYQIKAIVTDNLGYTATSNLVDITVTNAPTISITSPQNGDIIQSLSDITLRAMTASKSARAISKVEFFVNDKYIFTGVAQGSNIYEFVWKAVSKGTYTIKAKATDNNNISTESTSVTIEVDNRPYVTILSPVQNSAFVADSDITIQANAVDPGKRSIQKVDYYANNVLLGTVTSGTDNVYSFVWQKAPAGMYDIKVKATDNNNFTNEAIARNIKLNIAPIVAITAPSNGSVFSTNSPVSIVTQASDTDRNSVRVIKQVEIFANAQKIATLTTSPYSYNWTPGTQGQYALTAIATDNHGHTGSSNAVNIVVTDAPVVSITSPENGSVFLAPANILLGSVATDSPETRTISKVEFFVNNALVGQGSTTGNNLYVYEWKDVAAGNYTIKSKATDDKNIATESTSISIIVNQAPIITLDAPKEGDCFPEKSNIGLSATAIDNARSIQKVEFYAGELKLATITTPPYQYNWFCESEGEYALKAVATDNHGATTQSNVVNIVVNDAPVVAITYPTNGSILPGNGNIVLKASAEDHRKPSIRTIAKVEFFVNNVFKGQGTLASGNIYEYSWNSVPEGSYTIKAKATDDQGTETESAAVSILVNNLPQIGITSPANNAILDASKDIVIEAEALDTRYRSIKQVDFYANSTLLGTATTGVGNVYSYTWKNATPGSYALKARATDNNDSTSDSSIVNIKANLGPTVKIDYPANNAIIQETEQITILVTANDPGRSLSKVEFFSGSTKLGESTVSPYSFVWLNPALGSHTLKAKAWDNDGYSQESDPISIQIDPTFPNFITITSETTEANYPVQIGRPFIKGKISDYPQAVMEGTPLLTQADVKCRWDDGSVKHAILSFVVPEIAANTPVKISFQNQGNGNNTGYETKSNMLNNYNFDAEISITSAFSAENASASARTMLSADHFTYWTQGSVCTTIILADHSTNRLYDMGLTDPQSANNKSLRPIFHASFWPAIDKVYVRFIGEIANTEALQGFWYVDGNVAPQKPAPPYHLTLKLGTAREVVYTQNSVYHHILSRWTKKFWLGGSVPLVSINHNVKYLAATKLLNNYDSTVQVSETEIASQYGFWQSASKNLFDAGNWGKYMPGTGGRPDIGPHPDWIIQWIYSGDKRMFEKSSGNADLAGAWQGHLREGQSGRYFDAAGSIDALGKVLSIYARKSLFLMPGYFANYSSPYFNKPEDRAVPKESPNPANNIHFNGGWVFQPAHCPDPFSMLYLLTGEYWYLEEMYFWTSYQASFDNPGYRGPDSAGGLDLGLEPRGVAWAFRTRVRTAAFAPDGTPEKAYFERLVEDTIAIWEGQRNITGTSYENNANWLWGNTSGKNIVWDGYSVPNLHVWYVGTTYHVNHDSIKPANPPVRGASPWEFFFVMYSLGHAKELGYKTDALTYWLGEFLVDALNNLPSYYLTAYRMPTIGNDNQWYTSIATMQAGYNAAYDFAADYNNDVKDAVHGYPNILVPAIAAARDADVPNSAQAWTWIMNNSIPDSGNYTKDLPKWRIFTRK